MRVLFAGGDARYVYLAKIACALQHEVKTVGMENADIDQRLKTTPHDFACDAVIMPMPYRDQSGFIPAPYAQEKLPFDAFFKHIPKNATLYCGGADAHLYGLAKARGFAVRDIFAEDAFATLNAVPSAEGAIYTAMSRLPITICDANAMIVGYGRLGRVLGAMLNGLNARVVIAARSQSARAQAGANGHEAIDIAQIPQKLPDMRVVFNTVPAMVLTDDVLNHAYPRTVLIELASRPYGIDADAAARHGLNYALECGLPGRYSPETAAMILAQTIFGGDKHGN